MESISRFHLALVAYQQEGNLVLQREVRELAHRVASLTTWALEQLVMEADVRRALVQEAPSLIVLFPVSAGEMHLCIELSAVLRELEYEGHIVLAQIEPWLKPEHVLHYHPEVDGILRYRAPEGLTPLVNELELGITPEAIQGLHWRQRPAGRPVLPPAPPGTLWPHFPADQPPMPMLMGRKCFPSLSSLTCSGACPGCPAGAPQQSALPEEALWANKLARELESAWDDGAGLFVLHAPDPIGVDQAREPSWGDTLGDYVAQFRKKETLSGPQLILKLLSDEVTPELLETLKRSGLVHVILRHRFAHPDDVTFYTEPRLQVLQRALQALSDAGISAQLHYIAWAPGPRLEELQELVDLVRSYQPLPLRWVWLPGYAMNRDYLRPDLESDEEFRAFVASMSEPRPEGEVLRRRREQPLKQGGRLLELLAGREGRISHGTHSAPMLLARLLLSYHLFSQRDGYTQRLQRLTPIRLQHIERLLRDVATTQLKVLERQIEACQWGSLEEDRTGAKLLRELDRRAAGMRDLYVQLNGAIYELEAAMLPAGVPLALPTTLRLSSTGHELCWSDSDLDPVPDWMEGVKSEASSSERPPSFKLPGKPKRVLPSVLLAAKPVGVVAGAGPSGKGGAALAVAAAAAAGVAVAVAVSSGTAAAAAPAAAAKGPAAAAAGAAGAEEEAPAAVAAAAGGDDPVAAAAAAAARPKAKKAAEDEKAPGKEAAEEEKVAEEPEKAADDAAGDDAAVAVAAAAVAVAAAAAVAAGAAAAKAKDKPDDKAAADDQAAEDEAEEDAAAAKKADDDAGDDDDAAKPAKDTKKTAAKSAAPAEPAEPAKKSPAAALSEEDKKKIEEGREKAAKESERKKEAEKEKAERHKRDQEKKAKEQAERDKAAQEQKAKEEAAKKAKEEAAKKAKERAAAAKASAKELEKLGQAEREKKKKERADKGLPPEEPEPEDKPPKLGGPLGKAVEKALAATKAVSDVALEASKDKTFQKAKDVPKLAAEAAAAMLLAAALLEAAEKDNNLEEVLTIEPEEDEDRPKDKKDEDGSPEKDAGPDGGGGGPGGPQKPPHTPKGPKSPKPPKPAGPDAPDVPDKPDAPPIPEELKNPPPDSPDDPDPDSPSAPPKPGGGNVQSPMAILIFQNLCRLNLLAKFLLVPTQFDPGMLVKFVKGDTQFEIGDLAAMAISVVKSPSPFKIHVATAIKIGAQYVSFINDTSRGIVLAWNIGTLTTTFTGIIINGPIGMLNPGGMKLGPTINGMIFTVMGVPWGIRPNLGNLLAIIQGFKLAKAICSGLADGFKNWGMGYMNQAIPFPGGAVALGSMIPSPNIPVPLVMGNSSMESMVSPAQLKNLMLANCSPPGNHVEAMCDSFAKTFNTMHTLWKATNLIMLVIGAGGAAPAPVPGPVAGASGNGGFVLGMPVL